VLVDNVRVLDVRVQPGQKIAMHSHPPSTIYYMTACNFNATGPDGKSQVVEAKARTAIWRGDTTHAAEKLSRRAHDPNLPAQQSA
jgi:hypothetical protein